MSTITWLHLSDLHFQTGAGSGNPVYLDGGPISHVDVGQDSLPATQKGAGLGNPAYLDGGPISHRAL
jgi:hypothetical protein